MSHVSPVAYGAYTRQSLCVPHVLAEWSKHTPDAFAILAPGRSPLTYKNLQRHMDEVLQTLRAMGLGRHDRIAILLPNGPELAVALLAVAASATCVPLNPTSSADEFAFYLTEDRKYKAEFSTRSSSPSSLH